MVIKSSYQRDLLPKNNTISEVIPQIKTNDADEFLFVYKYVQECGYKELNWNLGYPYPMVTKCSVGSGLISNTQKSNKFWIKSKTNLILFFDENALKLGYYGGNSWCIAYSRKYAVKNVAVQARLGKQLYKGGEHLDAFQTCIDQSKVKLYYNGDITLVVKFHELQDRFPPIYHWMIRRGLIADLYWPFII